MGTEEGGFTLDEGAEIKISLIEKEKKESQGGYWPPIT